MSRALPKYNKRRVVMIGGASAVVLSAAVIAGSALAGETHGNGAQNATTKAAPAGTVNCPAVAPSLPAIPASAKAEVDRNLTLLNTQIAEANKRLVDTVGQGGPNFVQNAILGPLKDKRVATINRIATAIGRTAAKPQGLDSLAPCTLDSAGAPPRAVRPAPPPRRAPPPPHRRAGPPATRAPPPRPAPSPARTSRRSCPPSRPPRRPRSTAIWRC